MKTENWNTLLYSDEEFNVLYEMSNGFNDDINKNHRVREMNEAFSQYMDDGSTALVEEHPTLVKSLL